MRALGQLRDGVQHITAMAGGDIGDPQLLAGSLQQLRCRRNRPQQVRPADANAAPADRVEVAAIDQLADQQCPLSLVAVHVVEAAAGIETLRQPDPDTLGQAAERAHGQPGDGEIQPAQRECRQRLSEAKLLVAGVAVAMRLQQ